MAKVEIAKFSPLEAWSYAFLVLGISIAVILPEWNRLSNVSTFAHAWEIESAQPDILLAMLMVPLCLAISFFVIRQLVFRKGCAVWISGGKLYFVDHLAFAPLPRVPLSDIDHMTVLPATAFRSSTVVLHMRDGSHRRIPSMLLTISAEPIRNALHQALAKTGRG